MKLECLLVTTQWSHNLKLILASFLQCRHLKEQWYAIIPYLNLRSGEGAGQRKATAANICQTYLITYNTTNIHKRAVVVLCWLISAHTLRTFNSMQIGACVLWNNYLSHRSSTKHSHGRQLQPLLFEPSPQA